MYAMYVAGIVLRIAGSLCLFIFGMKLMSEGVQKSAGDRLRKTLNFMTRNRFLGALTGFVVTVILQSSTTTTLLIVSFANAGLLNLTQSIGVIMGANVGTTLTAWIVSFVGFSLRMSDLAIPAIGIGFVLTFSKWEKGNNAGSLLLGFGLLFLGLQYLTTEMRGINELVDFSAIGVFRYGGFATVAVSAFTGVIMAALMNSSSAATVVILTMAYSGVISFEMSAAMVLGSNLGTTISMPLAAIGARVAAKRAALVHVLFNAAGFLWALPALPALLRLVDFFVPLDPVGVGAAMHLAMLHTVYNLINTAVFLPFVTPFTKLVTLLVKNDDAERERAKGPYVFASFSPPQAGALELNILRVEKEARDMAGITASMYTDFTSFLRRLRDNVDKEGAARLCADLKKQEEYVDEMRESLSDYLIQCTMDQINPATEARVSRLLMAITDIEKMSDECYNISCLLEKNVRKDRVFKREELEALIPYVNMVEEILDIIKEHLGHAPTGGLSDYIATLEQSIKKSRKKLKKLSRKRIEAGEDVRTELAFIDLVQTIEKLGKFCIRVAGKLNV